MAKSLEDTAFYRYHRLLALNEVGGDPAAGALAVETFHDMMRTRAKQWPHGMTATATHDTKRGEDARARLLALAEIPGEWASAVGRWKILNAPHLVVEGSMRSPSAAFEYMLYQALVGAWPLAGRDDAFLERMQAYALKAAREGKQETSWLNPHAAYEAGLRDIPRADSRSNLSAEFLGSLQSFTQRTSLLGALNSLSQITLKATMPGVPDFYQGTEFWDFSLVDPDNRRPVDFAARASALGCPRNAGLGKPRAKLDRRPHQARLDPASVKAAHRTRRRLCPRRLPAAGSHRAASRSRHCLRAASRRRRRHYSGWEIARTAHARRPGLARRRAYDGAIVTKGYSLEGISGNELPLADAFKHLPAAMMKAKVAGRRRGKKPEPN